MKSALNLQDIFFESLSKGSHTNYYFPCEWLPDQGICKRV